MKTLAELVKTKRLSLSLSFRKLGKKAGVNASWIARVERGEIPSPFIAMKIAKALGEDEEFFKNLAIEAKLKKQQEHEKKRSLVYHSPLSADDIESILQEEEKRIDNLFEKEVINKRRLEEIGLAAAGPVKLDFKTKKVILEQLRILKKENKRRK